MFLLLCGSICCGSHDSAVVSLWSVLVAFLGFSYLIFVHTKREILFCLDLLALLYVVFCCVFVAFPCDVQGQVWCLMVSIFDLYLFFTLTIIANIGF